MFKPTIPITLFLLLILSLGASSQSLRYLQESKEAELVVDDETCLHDPDCHRNVTVCAFKGCCSYKECFDDGECVVSMPRCVVPEEPVLVDNETCFNDPNCRRNVTVCAFEGCCSFKSCPENGDECMIAMPMCIVPEEPVEVDNETCFNDPNCRRNVTVCSFEGCCSFKECPENGDECMIAMPMCIIPEEPVEEFDDETCFNDPNCHRNVTLCSFEGCCSYKTCLPDEKECFIAMPMCIVPEEPVAEVDNQTCFNDPTCRRNVTVCAFEGCCSWKECPENGDECMVAMAMCILPEEPVEEVDNETCFNDPTCHRNVTVCYFEGCCGFKECPENGDECMIAMPDCIAPEPEVPVLDDEACFNDPNCRRNVTVCAFEGCCSFKSCPENGDECMIAMPMCIAPEEPVEEVDDETCFNDANCHRNVTICSFEGCCSYKTCLPDSKECFIAMPMCLVPEPPVIDVPPVVEVDDETCFNDPNCRRNVTVCAFEGCCSFKECPEDGSECMIAMAMCIAPEEPIEVLVPVVEEVNVVSTNPPKIEKPRLRSCGKKSKTPKKSLSAKN